MSQEIDELDVNNAISLENSSNVKEEFQNECYPYNKVFVSETTVNISSTETNVYMKNDKIRKYEMVSVDHIKTDLSSSKVNDTISKSVKVEDGICPANIRTEFCNELLLCNYCHEVYQNYCTKCRVLVHVLNKRLSHNIYDRVRELPKYMLESRESTGHLGIFSLKVIPEDVRFGPFTGLNLTVLPLRIKGGRFVVSDNKSELLNWMQYVNPARNIYEQNLFPFQYEGKLYYFSTRKIQVGEELLVYFGEEYENNLLENVEMDFVPITKEDVENVFACTFCCLGFNSRKYLAEHKKVFHKEINNMFTVEELAQCPFCKIYFEAKEYFEHHMDCCCETNDRYCVLPTPKVHKLEVKRRSFLRRKAKRCKRGIYKCARCKFRTNYNADFRRHTNKHYEVKMYKCGICHRRYKASKSFKAHVELKHADDVRRAVQKYSASDYPKPNIKNIKERPPHSHDGEKHCQSSKCKFKTKNKYHLKSLIKIKHKNKVKYKCANCEFKTYYKTYLKIHMKMRHYMESNYKCMECGHVTSRKADLKRHIRTKHLKLKDYKCTECEYETIDKPHLQIHIKTKHLKEYDYECTQCEFQTNYKSHLEAHMKAKHLRQNDYKCMECEFKTNYKSSLGAHVKMKHLKKIEYKCMDCEFKTYYKSNLKIHIKTKHLKVSDYKCVECEYTTTCQARLNVHVKTKHLKEHDYKCVECEYKTNYKSHLKTHVKTKHLK